MTTQIKTTEIECKTCNQGVMTKKKKYRMSAPVVVIGYLLLIPCIIGMLIGLIGIFATGASSSEVTEALNDSTREQLIEAEIPKNLIQKVISDEVITEVDKEKLTDQQRLDLSSIELSHSAGELGSGAGSAIAGGLSIAVIIFSFIGGLLGWLLIMKKKVLQCGACSTVIAAS